MTLVLNLVEVLQQRLTLVQAELVDPASKCLVHENGLQTRHGVRSDDGVTRPERVAAVLWRSTRGRPKCEAVADRLGAEHLGGVGGGESLEEGLHGGREEVVDLVGGHEEGVAAGRREGVLRRRKERVRLGRNARKKNKSVPS